MLISPLQQFPFYATRDPAVAYAVLSPLGVVEYEVIAGSLPYEACVNRVSLRDLSLAHSACTSGLRIKFSRNDVMFQRVCLKGSARSISGNVTTDIDQHRWSALVAAGEGAILRFEPGYEELRMIVADQILKRKLGALLGETPIEQLSFTPNDDVESPALSRFRRLLTFLLRELELGGPSNQGAVLDEIAEALLISYLHAHLHNFSDRLMKLPSAPSLSQQRRVEDYIGDRWNEAINIEEIAKAVNVSARSIFRNFQELHGCSPFEYIKRLRLQHAHAMLLAGGPESKVTGVALKCGFHSLGHFARNYRIVYGELPSETARRVQR